MSNLTPRLSADEIVARDGKWRAPYAIKAALMYLLGAVCGALGAYFWERFAR